jgi:hypothetical protein
MNKAVASVILLFLSSVLSFGQELNCKVVINADRVQTTERGIFTDMQSTFSQFMSTTRWTNDVFESFERINCNINVTIESMPSIGSYNATVHIQSARPAFGSNYESLLLNFADRDWQFEYTQSQPLEYTDNVYSSNLTSMLSFYAYIILGLDYDSFGKMSGDQWYNKAQNILNLAQSSNRTGWQAFDSNRNRYWLIENLTNQQMAPLREGIYNYHRLGIDRMVEDQDGARQQILNVLKEIQKVNNLKPNSILVISFFDAKSDELLQVFSQGNMQVRREAYDIITKIDPTKIDRFQSILQN